MAIAALLLVAPTIGATLTVVQDGSGDFTDIQAAIEAAASGDTVEVAAGVYEGALDFLGKDLQVIGVDGAAQTTIDGDGETFWAVTFESGESSAALLQGFTISNTTGWGGIHIQGADPQLSDLRISGFDVLDASAVQVEDGGPSFRGVTFADNTSDGKGGHLRMSNPVDVMLEDCSFTGGTADDHGGGVYVVGDGAASRSLTLVRCNFEGNAAPLLRQQPLRTDGRPRAPGVQLPRHRGRWLQLGPRGRLRLRLHGRGLYLDRRRDPSAAAQPRQLRHDRVHRGLHLHCQPRRG